MVKVLGQFTTKPIKCIMKSVQAHMIKRHDSMVFKITHDNINPKELVITYTCKHCGLYITDFYTSSIETTVHDKHHFEIEDNPPCPKCNMYHDYEVCD